VSGARSPRSRYSRVAMLLHWAVAALILANIALGLVMTRIDGLAQFTLFQLHKSLGITALLLTCFRIGWRLAHPAPPLPAAMSPLQRRAAGAAHGMLYLLMLALPLTGWVIVSASLYNLPTVLFGRVPWPHLAMIHALPVAVRRTIESDVGTAHMMLGWLLLALVALHVAAALKHQLIDRDNVIARMLPWGMPAALTGDPADA
jgi:cytochrome b561